MGYPGYPQQNWQGQPHTGYAGQAPTRSGPGLAIFTGILGLGIAGALLTETLMTMSDLSDAPDLPGGWIAMWVIHFVVAACALLGAVLVFARKLAGAFLLMTSAVLTVLVLLLDPAMAESLFVSMLGALPDFEPSGDYANYFKAMFEFGNEQAVLRVVLGVLGLLLMIFAVLPASLDWLREGHRQNYGPYAQRW